MVGVGFLVWAGGITLGLRSVHRSYQDRTLPPRILTGRVVYLGSSANPDGPDTFSAAIDGGTAGTAVRYGISREIHDSLRLHSWLRLTVTACRGLVLAAQPIPTPPEEPPAGGTESR